MRWARRKAQAGQQARRGGKRAWSGAGRGARAHVRGRRARSRTRSARGAPSTAPRGARARALAPAHAREHILKVHVRACRWCRARLKGTHRVPRARAVLRRTWVAREEARRPPSAEQRRVRAWRPRARALAGHARHAARAAQERARGAAPSGSREGPSPDQRVQHTAPAWPLACRVARGGRGTTHLCRCAKASASSRSVWWARGARRTVTAHAAAPPAPPPHTSSAGRAKHAEKDMAAGRRGRDARQQCQAGRRFSARTVCSRVGECTHEA